MIDATNINNNTIDILIDPSEVNSPKTTAIINRDDIFKLTVQVISTNYLQIN